MPNANDVISPSGSLFEYAVSGASRGIAVGPYGNIWFTEYNVDKLGRITPAGLTEYATPATPIGAVTGPDGNIWFNAQGTNNVVQFVL